MKFFKIAPFFLFFLLSCGEAPKSERKLEVSFGSISAAQPTMLYGYKIGGTEKFAKKLESSSVSIPLTDGLWKFQAIYWTASAVYMEASPRCGTTQIELTSSISTVNLSLSDIACTQSEWMGNYGWTQMPYLIFSFFNLEFCPSSTPNATAQNFGSCPTYTPAITGIKVNFPAYTGSSVNSDDGLNSECYPINYSSNYLPLKLPYGNASSPLFTILKTYTGAPGCTGASCCSGTMKEYEFPNGLGQGDTTATSFAPTSGSNRMLKIVEAPTPHLSIQANPFYNHDTCESVTLTLKTASNTPAQADGNLPINLICTDCNFYSSASCSGAISTTMILNESSSVILWVKNSAPRMKMTLNAAPSVASAFAPATRELPLTIPYSSIDGPYLFSAPPGVISNETVTLASFVPGAVFIFQTNQGHRGKMQIISNSNTSPRTITYDYVTYDAGFSTIASSSSTRTVTACLSDPCHLDFDIDIEPLSTANGIESDAWLQTLGGTDYWSPQGTFTVIPQY